MKTPKSLIGKVMILFLLCLCILNTGCTLSLNSPYTVPFAAEDVACVTVTYGTWSETALIDDQEGITFLIDKMNQIEICFVNTVSKADETAPGNGHDMFLFEMNDGKEYIFSAMQINSKQTIFFDEEGKKHEVRNFHPNEFWEQIYCKY